MYHRGLPRLETLISLIVVSVLLACVMLLVCIVWISYGSGLTLVGPGVLRVPSRSGPEARLPGNAVAPKFGNVVSEVVCLVALTLYCAGYAFLLCNDFLHIRQIPTTAPSGSSRWSFSARPNNYNQILSLKCGTKSCHSRTPGLLSYQPNPDRQPAGITVGCVSCRGPWDLQSGLEKLESRAFWGDSRVRGIKRVLVLVGVAIL